MDLLHTELRHFLVAALFVGAVVSVVVLEGWCTTTQQSDARIEVEAIDTLLCGGIMVFTSKELKRDKGNFVALPPDRGRQHVLARLEKRHGA